MVQRVILEIVARAAAVKKAALNLVKQCGILPWLTTTLASRYSHIYPSQREGGGEGSCSLVHSVM